MLKKLFGVGSFSGSIDHYSCLFGRARPPFCNSSYTSSPMNVVGPCPHKEKDYRIIRSNFWKFYLIRNGFFGENV
jgi:hypothetical protein